MLAGRLIAGVLLLVLGRRLFWLYVAILGFVTGLTVSSQLFNIESEVLQFLIAIAFGLVGALVASFLQGIAVATAGFLGGAYVASSLLAVFAANTNVDSVLAWGLFILGGIIGAVLAVTLFDWALIILTSLSGALLIMEGLSLTGPGGWLIVLVLFAVGVIIQSGLGKSSEPPRTASYHHSHSD